MKSIKIALPGLEEDRYFAASLQVCQRLKSAGHQAFLVGGCVRDLVMGIQPKDYDVTTSALPQEVMDLFPKAIPVGVQFGVVNVRMKGFWFEVATFRGEDGYYDGRHPERVWFSSLEQDLQRRDFTMNALVMDPSTGEITDMSEGLTAIDRRIIRAIGDPLKRFEEDRLRMLRAVRFSAQTGFTIDPETLQAIATLAPKIARVSRERIRKEMEELLTTANPEKGLVLALDLGLLRIFLPAIVDYGRQRLLELGGLIPKIKEMPAKWAVLLKDCGSQAAYMAMLGLKHSNKVCNTVRSTIEGLKRLASFSKLGLADQKRLVRSDEFVFVYDVARVCDQKIGITKQEIRQAGRLLETSSKDDLFPPALLTGDDIKAMGYIPGPAFARVIAALEDARLSGDIVNREQAVKLVHQLMAWEKKDS